MNDKDWKEEFLKLYTSEKLSDIENALKLKLAHIPKKLYRYRSFSFDEMQYRYNEIVKGELYLQSPKNLNDPFEACSLLHAPDPANYIRDKKRYESEFSGIIPEDRYKEIFSNSNDNWLESLFYYISETIGNHASVNENAEKLKKLAMYSVEVSNSEFSEISRGIVKLASFSTKPNNLPMWHHYTNGHSGICLEYNTDAIIDIYPKNRLFPVYYVEQLPDVVSMISSKACPKHSLYEYLAMHKLNDWCYENEWRLIYDVGFWYNSPEDVPKGFFNEGKAIQFIRPSKIIIGVKMNDALRTKIEEMASSANIPIIQAKQTDYGLDVV